MRSWQLMSLKHNDKLPSNYLKIKEKYFLIGVAYCQAFSANIAAVKFAGVSGRHRQVML